MPESIALSIIPQCHIFTVQMTRSVSSDSGFVMAAGASRKFGDIKQLAKIDGVSMALRSHNILNKVKERRIWFGSKLEFIAREFQEVNTIYNRQWSMGLGSSISFVQLKWKMNPNVLAS